MSEYKYHYSKFPALRKYIDRVGAEQLNHRRFIVKEYHGSHYYVERILITVDSDFKIIVTARDTLTAPYEPTTEEHEAITAELSTVKWPRPIHAGEGEFKDLVNNSGLIKGNAYAFWNNARTEIIMAQERRQDRDGKKFYVPWTLFDVDGEREWKMMEPDGALPFWKPPKNRQKGSVMVHEGAKTAAFVDGLINDPLRKEERTAHPWAEELEGYEHWGAIGGALAAHRCDYAELKRENIEGDLVYVADNDFVGTKVVETFSRKWGGRMYAVRFDDYFPAGFDLADEIPRALFSKSGVIQRRLLDMMKPATHATVKLPKVKGETGRPAYALTKAFEKEWVHIVDQNFFCHVRMTNHVHKNIQRFNHAVAPFSDVDDTARLLIKSWSNMAVTVEYDPAQKPGLYHGSDKQFYYNLYQPSPVRDYKKSEAKNIDYSPWVNFLEILIPNEIERSHVSKWAATLMAVPGLKMNYGLLLVSHDQGVGKTTFTDCITDVLGKINVEQASENGIIGRFRSWAQKQLIVVNEIYQGHSTKAYDTLKDVITDKRIHVEEKFVSEYTVDNHVHIIACSNSMKALRFDNTDRRWFVPYVTSKKYPNSYWTEFHDWIDEDDGPRKIKQWAKDYVKEHGHVVKGAEAPWTHTKQEMIEESDSPGIELVRSVFQTIREVCRSGGNFELNGNCSVIRELAEHVRNGKSVVFFDGDGETAVRSYLRDEGKQQGNGYNDGKAMVRKVAVQEGFFVGKERLRLQGKLEANFNCRIISLDPVAANINPRDLSKGQYEIVGFHILARELVPPRL